MSNVKQLGLANDVFHRLSGYGPQLQAASPLVSSAAFQVGFVRLAAGLARWSREPTGQKEIQARLSDEQFDVIMLAPIDSASKAAVACIDLCAAAGYRLCGATPLRKGRESDVQHLLSQMRKQTVTLRPSLTGWLNIVVASPQWQLLEQIRTAVTHRAIQSYSSIGGGPPITDLVVGGTRYDVEALSTQLVQFVEEQFEHCVTAILKDFP